MLKRSLLWLILVCITVECQEYHVFTDCRTLPVTYTFSDPSIFKLVEDNGKQKVLNIFFLVILNIQTVIVLLQNYNGRKMTAQWCPKYLDQGSYDHEKVMESHGI